MKIGMGKEKLYLKYIMSYFILNLAHFYFLKFIIIFLLAFLLFPCLETPCLIIFTYLQLLSSTRLLLILLYVLCCVQFTILNSNYLNSCI